MTVRNALLTTVIVALVVCATAALSTSRALGHSNVSVVSQLTSTPPAMDGVLGAGEWSSAGTLPFTIQTVSGILYVMHDSTFLYVAGVVSDPTSGLNSFQLIFDNDHDGVAEAGDDALVVNLGNFGFDDYFNGVCCFLFDTGDGGTNDVTASGVYANNQATFELAHPLCSPDSAHDFCLSAGSTVGFNVVYQPGNGAFYSGFPSVSPFNAPQFGDLVIQPEQPAVTQVAIDIKPGSFPNSINPRSRGRLPVALLSSAVFDAPIEVDRTSLTFGRTGDETSLAFCNWGQEDVDADGRLDLVCHFNTQTAAFQPGDSQGILKGLTVSGTPFTGTDSIRLAPEGTP